MYTHFALSGSDLVVVARHTISKKILLSYFTVNSDKTLKFKRSKEYTESENIEILGISLSQDDDVSDGDLFAKVYYAVGSGTHDRGKALIANMENGSNDAQSYFFTPDDEVLVSRQETQSPREWEQSLTWFTHTNDGDHDWMYYGGSTNYIQGSGTDSNLKVDWRDTPYELGFLSAWSDNVNCITQQERANITFGIDLI